MSVRHDVYEGTVKNKDNPGAKVPEPEAQGADYWEKKTKEERARREYEEERARANKPKTTEDDSPFKIKGEVNLGKYDFQAQQEALREQMEQIRKDYEKQLASLQQNSEHYKDKVYELQFTMMEKMFSGQIVALQSLIKENLTKPQEQGLDEQITKLEKLAGVLGWRKQGAASDTPAELRLQMLKIEMEAEERRNEFQRKMKADDRQWQLDLKKMDLEKETAAQIRAQEERRSTMLAAIPEVLGRSIGRSILERPAGRGVSEGSEEVEAPKRTKKYVIEAGVDMEGEINCPQCSRPVFVGGDARTAVCSNCNLKMDVKRSEQAPDGKLGKLV